MRLQTVIITIAIVLFGLFIYAQRGESKDPPQVFKLRTIPSKNPILDDQPEPAVQDDPVASPDAGNCAYKVSFTDEQL